MSNPKLQLSFSLFFFFITLASSSSSFFNSSSKCSVQQSFALLRFKKSLSSINDSSFYAHYCQDRLGSRYHSVVTMNWNKNTDCCKWNGITCDHFTGDVIGVDLSCGMLQGTVHLNTTLFHLPRLQRLNLAFNDFDGSQLPREIGRLSNTLTHLNLSHCGLNGEIPSEVLLLSKLVSLDLSHQWYWNRIDCLRIQPYVLNSLLQNSTHLRELLIAGANVSWDLPTHLNISSSLRSLDLSFTNLQVKLPNNIFNLQYLQTLDLSGSGMYYIPGPLPKVPVNQSSLRFLSLRESVLQGKLPDYIFNLQKLEHLDLSWTNITGHLPKVPVNQSSLRFLSLIESGLQGKSLDYIFNLQKLEHLDLSWTNITGPWPKVTVNQSSLRFLSLRESVLQGKLPDYIFNLQKLEHLDLSWTDITGPLPKVPVNQSSLRFLSLIESGLQGKSLDYIFNLQKLEHLDLSWTNITGPWPKVTVNQSSLRFLSLRESVLQGKLPDYIFNLQKLEHLDLSWTDITGPLPKVPVNQSSLRFLSLSFSGLQGKLPDYIFNLQNLEHLDLSGTDITGPWPKVTVNQSSLRFLSLSYSGLQGKLPDYIFNLQNLEHLDLSGTDITGPLPKVTVYQSSLRFLSLRYSGLQGKLPDYIFNLQNLEHLDLSWTHITGHFPKFNTGTDIPPLEWLDLSYTHLSGEIPYSIGHLKSLKYLDLSFSKLLGGIPHSIGHLNRLKYLDLSDNNLSGEIPFSIGNLKSLESLHLTVSSGEIPYSIGKLKSLKTLNLSFCGLVGSLPKSLVNLKQLTSLQLNGNMLTGTLPSSVFPLPFLESINLSGNKFSGGLPSGLFNSPTLRSLWLGDNQFDSEINQSFIAPSFNRLSDLELSRNNFTGELVLETLLSSLPNIYVLDLSYSGLSVVTTNNATAYINPWLHILGLASCKLTVFPESLQSIKYLSTLDLSRNSIEGPIPDWAGVIGGYSLQYLDLSHNSITSLPQFQWEGLVYLILESNLIEGPFPPSICNMSYLQLLDMSDNRFTGVIPQCVGNFSSALWKVALSNNQFHGTIPDMCNNGSLDGIILKGNQLEGEVSTSLSKCRSLEILDLGNNRLNGTFPGWLGNLSRLQVLILRSNNFRGPVEASSSFESPFPLLKVLDLSHNGFTGHLPQKYFQSFNAMKNAVRKGPKPEYLGFGSVASYYYFVIVMVKGQPLAFQKFPVDYNIVDMSDNKFEGEIPNVIGALRSLIVLNLSNNHLNGRIPGGLGNLSEIESLDLSWNQLTGEIPQSLADITNLEVLNLSHNNLKGRIPNGRQFATFDETSFGGNPGLCGLPLPKCDHSSSRQLEDEGDDDSGFTWKVVMLGFGCGILIGLVMGFIMLSTGRPKWFNEMANSVEYMLITRRNKRRFIYIGK